MSTIVKSLLFALLTFGITMVVSLLVAVIIRVIAVAVQRKPKVKTEHKS